MSTIPVSRKYGLNPSIPVCFWCGKEKNEIALLGPNKATRLVKDKHGNLIRRAYGEDREAPRHCVIDYEPCDECRQAMEQGITLLATSTLPSLDGAAPVMKDEYGHDVYPYPWYVVLTEDAIGRLFTKSIAEEILAKRKAFVPVEIIQALTDASKKAPEDES